MESTIIIPILEAADEHGISDVSFDYKIIYFIETLHLGKVIIFMGAGIPNSLMESTDWKLQTNMG